ncbi:MAG: hypothetical protein COT90_01975 [Candidatus Diapherotrites archaeon CG10_big_fil_rev_8_21_14_0_10_31_34]|nr:MAG: hypothetical protein COT90_01975 [Candidatus Diapherotrites archaeon CG10_big_fil_rev_8_21_14_0_10_31_34]
MVLLKNKKAKFCELCGITGGPKKFKFVVHGGQKTYYVCCCCVQQSGSAQRILEILEKIPLQQHELNFFKNETATQGA